MSYFGFFHGHLLSGLFAPGIHRLSTGAADYLKAYAIDTAGFHLCLLRRLL